MNAPARLAELEALALERFPDEEATVRLFLGELRRAVADPAAPRDEAVALLARFEDYLDALHVRARWR